MEIDSRNSEKAAKYAPYRDYCMSVYASCFPSRVARAAPDSLPFRMSVYIELPAPRLIRCHFVCRRSNGDAHAVRPGAQPHRSGLALREPIVEQRQASAGGAQDPGRRHPAHHLQRVAPRTLPLPATGESLRHRRPSFRLSRISGSAEQNTDHTITHNSIIIIIVIVINFVIIIVIIIINFIIIIIIVAFVIIIIAIVVTTIIIVIVTIITIVVVVITSFFLD